MKGFLSLAVAVVLAGLPAYVQKDENKRIRNAGRSAVRELRRTDC